MEKSPSRPAKCAVTPKLPLPSLAPWAVPDDETWRELQRRRNLLALVDTLAKTTRDDGYDSCAVVLFNASISMQGYLFQPVVRDSPELTKQKKREAISRLRSFKKQR